MPARQVIWYKRKPGQTSVKQRERVIQRVLTNWLRREYPDIDFFNDWASGAYLTVGQNAQRMSLAGRAWCDLLIPEPNRGFHGAFFELKREGIRPYLKDGVTPSASVTIKKEAAFLERMRDKGYYAVFCVGLEDAKQKIAWYLQGKSVKPQLDLDDLEF